MHLLESISVSMDLNTITAVAHPATRDRLPVWTAGDAWLAGGTWLFSEPQPNLRRLIDLTDLKWQALTVSETTLSIAATCTVAQLDALTCPPEWIASPLMRSKCCRAFLAPSIGDGATSAASACRYPPANDQADLGSTASAIWPAAGGERKFPSPISSPRPAQCVATGDSSA
jgi:hypothetical protein